jgi:hypothetical protein
MLSDNMMLGGFKVHVFLEVFHLFYKEQLKKKLALVPHQRYLQCVKNGLNNQNLMLESAKIIYIAAADQRKKSRKNFMVLT